MKWILLTIFLVSFSGWAKANEPYLYCDQNIIDFEKNPLKIVSISFINISPSGSCVSDKCKWCSSVKLVRTVRD